MKYLKVFSWVFMLFILEKVPAQVSLDFSTNLPLVVIDTYGNTIVDEPKVAANLKIIYEEGKENKLTDAANIYDGRIGIEIRGRSSSHYPQKPYLFETRNSDDSNNNVSLLGMPEENDWCLLSFYNDKSFARNILAFTMFREMGHYAPRARLCEVILNNEYQGIYLLTEKIKRDKNRVDIAKLKDSDNSGEEVSGGYIFKVDYHSSSDSWKSAYKAYGYPSFDVYFVYEYPDEEDITTEQKSYIHDYVSIYEAALRGPNYRDEMTGYKAYLDELSFIDYFIVNEVARNNDGFKKSRYFHKDKNGEIVAGPVWDFDWAWKNINECFIFKATDGSGWAYKVNDCNPHVKSPGWMIRLFQDDWFSSQTNCRYFELREHTINDNRLYAIVDSVYNLVEDAADRHFQRWDILGRNVGAPEVGSQPTTYLGEVAKLKDWIETRLTWLDENMIGECNTTGVETILADMNIRIGPNPVIDVLEIEVEEEIKEVIVIDVLGRVKLRKSIMNKSGSLNVGQLRRDVYIVQLVMENGNRVFKKIAKY
ncbi:T9SS type A sorting domain-containing protein [Puteibacter caeruleilacunae]|nr:T9SS type A sorting domain-containing protein [Puteibacter caeruleilacunae]